ASRSAVWRGGSRPRRSRRRGPSESSRIRASWSRWSSAGWSDERSDSVRTRRRLPAPGGERGSPAGRWRARLPPHRPGGPGGAGFLLRWAPRPASCHHQKSWLIDAGRRGEVAFVGGINLDHGSLVPPGHPPVGGGSDDDIYANVHDLYLELRGPAATDVQHNFVQRWNEASERERPDGAWPDAERAGRLPFPATLSPPAGTATVQITRTVRGGR